MAPSGHYTGVEIMDGLSLEDEFEIRQTLATYCMGIDRKDRALIRQCFARDIKAHYIDLGKWHDAETLADYMIEGHAHYPATMHQVTTTLRSEEHTSELQSLMRLSSAVFCLKKNKSQLTLKQ